MLYHRLRPLIVVVFLFLPLVLSAQRPEIVRDDMTGTIDVFIGTGGANRLRADLARSILDAGHHTVTQTTLCGDHGPTTYDWNMDDVVKNAEGQAQQPTNIKDPKHDDQGRLVGFEYMIQFRSKDSVAVGHARISYGPHGSWMEVRGDAADPSEYVFRADYDARGRLLRFTSSERSFDYTTRSWTDVITSWENVLGYDPAGRISLVSTTSLSGTTVTSRTEEYRVINAEGLVVTIMLYSDGDTFTCNGETMPAKTHRLANGMYMTQIEKFEYR